MLYLMRHGAAEDTAPSGRDADRSLTPAGRAAVRKVALALRDAQAVPIEAVIASPLARAQQTAEIVRGILCPEVEIDVDEDLAPDASAYNLSVRVAASGRVTLLVGHQPNIEMVARALARPTFNPHASHASHRTKTAGSPPDRPALRLPAGFRTATLVGFRIEGRPPPYALAVAIDPTLLDEPPTPLG